MNAHPGNRTRVNRLEGGYSAIELGVLLVDIEKEKIINIVCKNNKKKKR